jgi:hypothetical protein
VVGGMKRYGILIFILNNINTYIYIAAGFIIALSYLFAFYEVNGFSFPSAQRWQFYIIYYLLSNYIILFGFTAFPSSL